jgi:phage terminase large subunit
MELEYEEPSLGVDKFGLEDGDFADELEEIEFIARGGAAEFFLCRDNEVLLDGPAGTGKSRTIGEYLDDFCWKYPGVRVLILRKTRVSLNESFLVTLEQKVWGSEHPCLSRDLQKESRTHYDYPNGSRIVLGGMDNPTRLFSTEYDLIYGNECNELTLNEWESLNRALRNGMSPFHQLIGDCNPDTEFHWLNQRCNMGKTTRILSRHSDNPSITEAYLDRLRALSGVRYQRLYLGKWVSAEGQCYPEYDAALHCVNRSSLPDMKWHFGSLDWGFRAPGCFQVWGVTGEGVLYRLEEFYQTERQLDWWADSVHKMNKKYDLVRVACDPAEPRSIEMLNDRLGYARSRDSNKLCVKADNDITSGVDQVRAYFKDENSGQPLMYFVKGALNGRDPHLVEKSSPTCLEEELPSLVWAESKDGRPVREIPDPSCADHACDAMRYAVMFAWRKDMSRAVSVEKYAANSLGSLLQHDETMRKSTGK